MQIFLTFSCLYAGTQPKKVLPRSVSFIEKRYLFFTPAFLFNRFGEGVQEGYVGQDGMVDAPGHFFFRNSLYHPWPPHQQHSAQ